MARSSLPPGFRFHPTDVELILYYLKRKVMGKKLHFAAIAEVNIYNFSPWDLPDKSSLRSKDVEWFFFCPRERKYSTGVRVKRATENGYWKTTGKDRAIVHNDKTVGSVKTLIFHLGHAPKGDRTDWVIHEYRIIDEQLVAAGVQDSYVLCKVFKKSGLGPKNGAQYGAPFNEADWDDDVNDGQNNFMSIASGGPSLKALVSENQSSVMKPLFNPASEPEPSLIDNGDENLCSVVKGLNNIGSTSGLIEGGPSSLAGPTTSEALLDMSEDEMFHLLSAFTDDSTLLSNKNEAHVEDLNDKRKNKSSPCLDGYEIFNGLGDLDNCSLMNEGRFDMSAMQKDGYRLNNMLLQDNLGYIELNDLLAPLDYSPEVTGSPLLYDIFGSYNHENMQQFCSASGSSGIHQNDYCKSQLPMLNNRSNRENSSFGVLQTVTKLYCGHNAVYDSEFAQSQPVTGENMGQHSYQDMQRVPEGIRCICKFLPEQTMPPNTEVLL